MWKWKKPGEKDLECIVVNFTERKKPDPEKDLAFFMEAKGTSNF